jgi:dihydropyrimidinase
MEKVTKHGGIMVVHAEDEDIVQFMYEKFREEKRTEGRLLPEVHNKISEKLAFRRTIMLAAHTGAGLTTTPATPPTTTRSPAGSAITRTPR